jgi:hypothetical protein
VEHALKKHNMAFDVLGIKLFSHPLPASMPQWHHHPPEYMKLDDPCMHDESQASLQLNLLSGDASFVLDGNPKLLSNNKSSQQNNANKKHAIHTTG